MRIPLALTFVACLGCRQHDSEKPAPSIDQPMPQARLDGTLQLHMRNCPTAITGATTTSEPTADGVDVTITAADPTTRGEIVSSAIANAERGDPLTLRVPQELHSGSHTGTGTHGRCPIIHAGTAITVDATPAGVIVHERPYDASQLPALRAAVAARVEAITPTPAIPRS